MKVKGNIVDMFRGEVFPGTIVVENGVIVDIVRERGVFDSFIIPGFVDAHVHVESSMLSPVEFSRLAVLHGTIASVCDPHEIGNVLGGGGVEYMLGESAKSHIKMAFGVPSCVPATEFDVGGATIGVEAVRELMGMERIVCLGEVMNFPGVLKGDPEVMDKIAVAKSYGKPVDGHAPGLRGELLCRYVGAGISTDHESLSIDEAREKIKCGMKVIIREGSAAKSLRELYPLIDEFPGMVMFCTDDIHPDDLLRGHVDSIVREAVSAGCDVFNVLKAASLNPVTHYNLPMGLLRIGDKADFLKVGSLDGFEVDEVFVDGSRVVSEGNLFVNYSSPRVVNVFSRYYLERGHITVKYSGGMLRVIEAKDKTLVTGSSLKEPRVEDGVVIPDVSRDILKIVVVNRYRELPPAVGFIRGFGLGAGAIASSVAHDSHNVVAVGCDDADIIRVIRLIFEHGGGISAVDGNEELVLPLPIAGLMSDRDGFLVADMYKEIDGFVKDKLGSSMSAPFMTLSFMCLPVIPSLKITSRGLFDVDNFQFVDLFSLT